MPAPRSKKLPKQKKQANRAKQQQAPQTNQPETKLKKSEVSNNQLELQINKSEPEKDQLELPLARQENDDFVEDKETVNGDSNSSEDLNDDSQDYNNECVIKHPLQNQWTFWYLENDQSKLWEEMQNVITTFDTVEDFWSLYNHIKTASTIKQGNDYSLFKMNIRPMWEDPVNKNGGRWVLNVNKSLRNSKLDELWLDTLFFMLGEDFEYSKDISGAVVNNRHNGDRISLWTTDCRNKNSVLAIGERFKAYLRLERLEPDAKIYYESHKTTSKSKNSKPLYSI